jgi:Domain of unknown function (DUF3303)
MALFLSIISHGAAECAAHNEYYRKATLEGMSQMEELAKKHGVKIVGAWSVHQKHFQVVVYDAPSYEVVAAFAMEPPIKKMADMYDIDMWPVMTMQEVAQMLMQA